MTVVSYWKIMLLFGESAPSNRHIFNTSLRVRASLTVGGGDGDVQAKWRIRRGSEEGRERGELRPLYAQKPPRHYARLRLPHLFLPPRDVLLTLPQFHRRLLYSKKEEKRKTFTIHVSFFSFSTPSCEAYILLVYHIFLPYYTLTRYGQEYNIIFYIWIFTRQCLRSYYTYLCKNCFRLLLHRYNII